MQPFCMKKLYLWFQCKIISVTFWRIYWSTKPFYYFVYTFWLPRCRLSTYGTRAFSVAGPVCWNSL